MQKPSDFNDWEAQKDRVIGLGERSFHKSYYPQLRKNLESLERFRTLLDHTSDFVVLFSLPEYAIVDANAALGSLMGQAVKDLIGKSLTSLEFLSDEAMHAMLHMDEEAGNGVLPDVPFLIQFKSLEKPLWLELRCHKATLDRNEYGVIVGRDVSERKQAEDSLRSSEHRLRMALMNSQVTVFEQDLELRYVFNYRPYFGYSTESIIGKADRDILEPESAARLEAVKYAAIKMNKPIRQEVSVYAPGRGLAHYDLYVEPRHDGKGRVTGVLCTAVDITERLRADEDLRESEDKFRTIAASAHDAIIMMNEDGTVAFWNPAATAIFGYTREEVIGLHLLALLLPENYPKSIVRNFLDVQRHNEENPVGENLELDVRCKDGREITIEISTSFVKRNDQWKVISIARDISDKKAHQLELERVANYDALTGLPNRRLLSDRIHQGIAQSRRNGTQLAVCYFDLDNFKPINDRFGQDVGDQVLVAMASHLKVALRGEDTLARLSGDEFVVLLTNLSSIDEIHLVLSRISMAINAPILTRHAMLTLTASIGVAVFPAVNADPDTLMRHADQAMYMAKQSGKNCYRLFDQEQDQKVQTYIYYQQRLREALANGEFCLHYQPKVDMSNGDIVGMEALIRWQHPERGLISPGEFMQYMEGNDLEIAVGEWVIDSALREKTLWDALGIVFSVSINISPGHLLHPSFTNRLRAILGRYENVDPSDVVLEILESAALSDMKHASNAVARCRELGMRIALDDFGTGYSSLTYLRNLPIDVLKIDQSFVRDMLSDPSDLAIVVSVVQLAKTFNRTVIAEGVETLDHGARLVEVGCELMQGYGIARPMPPENVQTWSREWREAEAWKKLKGGGEQNQKSLQTGGAAGVILRAVQSAD